MPRLNLFIREQERKLAATFSSFGISDVEAQTALCFSAYRHVVLLSAGAVCDQRLLGPIQNRRDRPNSDIESMPSIF